MVHPSTYILFKVIRKVLGILTNECLKSVNLNETKLKIPSEITPALRNNKKHLNINNDENILSSSIEFLPIFSSSKSQFMYEIMAQHRFFKQALPASQAFTWLAIDVGQPHWDQRTRFLELSPDNLPPLWPCLRPPLVLPVPLK